MRKYVHNNKLSFFFKSFIGLHGIIYIEKCKKYSTLKHELSRACLLLYQLVDRALADS